MLALLDVPVLQCSFVATWASWCVSSRKHVPGRAPPPPLLQSRHAAWSSWSWGTQKLTLQDSGPVMSSSQYALCATVSSLAEGGLHGVGQER